MPYKPARPCNFSGCPNTVRGNNKYCINHQVYEKKEKYQYYKDKGQSTEDGFYQSKDWIRFRNWYRSKHPLCEECSRRGMITPMKIVDHIIPIKQGGDKFSENNSRSLCQECHNRKTAEDKIKYGD